MSAKRYIAAAMLLWGMLPAAMTGCSKECAEGTAERGGVCQPEATCGEGTFLFMGECIVGEAGCGEGAALDADGKCAPVAESCADGTTYDVGTKTCKPDASAVCGAGTVIQDGACIPDAQVCLGGAVRDERGRCVVSALACDTGTQLDANLGLCLPGDTACGIGLAFSGGRCVPAAEVCNTGTTFNTETRTCLPDVSCRPGDLLLNGVCTPPGELVVGQADLREAEPNDPFIDPTQANGFTPKPIGQTLTIAGGIGAAKDLDEDGKPDQDRDVFVFQATAGQLFEIAVQPITGAALGFSVFKSGDSGFTRFSPQGFDYGAAREIYIPSDGLYAIQVAPSAVFAGTADGIGEDDWQYVLSVKEAPLPVPFEINYRVQGLSGSFQDLSDNYFKLVGLTPGENIRATVSALGEDVIGAYAHLIDAQGQVVSTLELAAGGQADLTAPGTEAYVFFDWRQVRGDRQRFDVALEALVIREDLGTLASDTPVKGSRRTLEQDSAFTYVVNVPPGHVLEVFQENPAAEELVLEIYDAQGTRVEYISFMDPVDDSSADIGYVYSEQGGVYEVVVEPAGTTTPTAIPDVEVTVQAILPVDLGAKQPGESLSVDDLRPLGLERSRWYTFTLSSPANMSGTLTPGGLGDPDLYVYDATFTTLFSDTTTGADTIDSVLPAGKLIMELRADTALDAGYTLAATLDISEIEPNDDKATAQAIPFGVDVPGSAEVGGADVFKFTLPSALLPNEAVRVYVDSTSTSYDFDCRLLTSAATNDELFRQEERGDGCEIWYGGLGSGDYFIEIKTTDTSARVYTLRAEVVVDPANEVEPNDSKANANIITLGAPAIGGNIAPTTGVDVFAFTLPGALLAGEALHIAIPTSSSFRLTCRLLTTAATGDEVYVQTDRPGGCDMWLGGLSGGDYYVEVTTEDTVDHRLYTLAASIETGAAHEAEPNDTKVQATLLQLGASTVAAEVAPSRADYDLYAVTLLQPLAANQALHFKVTTSITGAAVDCRALTSAATGDEIQAALDVTGGCDLWLFGLGAGDYFAEIATQDTSWRDYVIQAEVVTDPVGDIEPNDTKATASNLPVGEAASGTIKSGEVDVFRVSLPLGVGAGEALYIKLEGTSTVHEYDCRLLSSAATGDAILAYENLDKGCEFWTGDLLPGDYYVEVISRETSAVSYTITPQLYTGVFVDLEHSSPNNTLATAQPLGALTLPATLYGQVNLDGSSVADEDVYTFTLSAPLASLSLNMDDFGVRTTSSLKFEVYDGAQTSLGVSSASGTTDSLVLSNPAAGTYYVRVYRTSTSAGYDGNYRMRFSTP